MPAKKKSGNNKEKTGKSEKKRLATSPLQEDNNNSTGVTSSQTGLNTKQTQEDKNRPTRNSVSKQNKRIRTASEDLSGSFMQNIPQTPNKLYTMNTMNYPQAVYSGQYMQALQTPPPSFNDTPPQWAIEIMEDLKTIKASVAKIDKIERTVDKINSKVDSLESKVKSIDGRLLETEKSAAFINKEFEESKKVISTTKSEIKTLSNKCDQFEFKLKKIESDNNNILEKTDDLEYRSMRENLLFHGIEEREHEHCEDVIHSFIQEALNITTNVTFDRVHRIGKVKADKCRPIVAKFHYYKERELVRNTAFEKFEDLKRINKRVGIQQTKAVLQKRNERYPIMDRERAAGKAVKWSGAKVMVQQKAGERFQEITK